MSDKRVLFVCTGNSCRSVMAQRLLEHILQQAGVDTVQTASAGVFAVEGMSATQETQRVLRGIGVECAGHLARMVTPKTVEEADVIFIMEQLHRDELLKRFPGAQDKIHFLKSYGLPTAQQEENPNIPDPIGKPMEVYEVCFDVIREAIARVAKSLGVPSS